MSGFRSSTKRQSLLSRVAALTIAALAVATMMVATPSAHAQLRRNRRESNANRKARIARTTQETYNHRYEFFGGGGYLRFRSGDNLQRNNEITWATSATYFLNPKVGIIADVRGSYGNAKVGNTIFNIRNPLITEYTFMGGPTYRFYAKQKMAASVHVLGGYSLGNFDGGTKGIPATLLGMWPTSNKAVFSAGFNLDYNFYPNFAFRLTPTYVGTTFGGEVQNNIGVNAGIVYRFGKIK
ncbi:hypothetical protein [Granulicella sp. dw_53]|uniref:hypothetical protein n=1 Tax=Granulicella sp. dw_53 TaxID=2719792 RepID=UPI001BD604C9|nr:hypothetical protein [Granulicella sp. dw_53]